LQVERHVSRRQETKLPEGSAARIHAGRDGPRDIDAFAERDCAQLLAQATQPLQSTPGAETKPSAPAEPATTGTRPSNVPPEPARPDADAQKAGAQPALPPAPAEKTAPPIKDR
jgi:hypothetical protein